MTAATTTMTTMSRDASMVLMPFLFFKYLRTGFILLPPVYLVTVKLNWSFREVTTTMVEEKPVLNCVKVPVGVQPLPHWPPEPVAPFPMETYTIPSALGVIAAGWCPLSSVFQVSLDHWLPLVSLT